MSNVVPSRHFSQVTHYVESDAETTACKQKRGGVNYTSVRFEEVDCRWCLASDDFIAAQVEHVFKTKRPTFAERLRALKEHE